MARPPLRSPLAAGAAGAALAVLATLVVPLTVPGAAPAARAQECRNPVVGEDMPDGGAYPLIDQLGLRQAWDLGTGAGVTVGVVDSGVDARHPDLDGAVARGSTFDVVQEPREFDRSTPPPRVDCEGHGTAVAGLVAARRSEGDRMAGVAPSATVYPVRVADGVDQTTARTLGAAIDDAAAESDVLNLSFAIPVDAEPVREAVERALADDVLVVAAAGNEGGDDGDGVTMYPAAYDGVLGVGAIGNDGQRMDSSNAGPWVDLAGYGEDLIVVSPGGEGYRLESGTSFAAAQVSGTAALVRARFPDLSAPEVAERLVGSATPIGGGRNEQTGAGVVDPFAALTHLDAGEEAGDGSEGDGAVAQPGGIPVQAIPESEPLLTPTAATALAWGGGLLLAVVLGLLAAPAVRRAARRGWRAGPAPGDDAPRPGPASGAGPAGEPPQGRIDWLDGSDTPTPDPGRAARPRGR